MRKLLMVLLAGVISVCFCLAGCGNNDEEIADGEYTVTFNFENKKVGEVKVKDGEIYGEIPKVEKPGYTVTFPLNPLLVIKDTTVNAVVSPKTYKITYDLGNADKYKASIGETEQSVVFGEDLELRIPKVESDDYNFYCWKLNGEKFENGKWELTEDITLTAAYSSIWTRIY